MTSNFIDQTIEKYDWSRLFTSTGDACAIPERLRGLISAATEPEALHWYNLLEDYIVVQEGVYESALPSIDVLLAAINNCQITNIAIVYIYDLIYQVIHGVTALDAIRRGNSGESDACKALVLPHLTLLQSKCVPEAEEILGLIMNEF